MAMERPDLRVVDLISSLFMKGGLKVRMDNEKVQVKVAGL
jgi:hypothetical protein